MSYYRYLLMLLLPFVIMYVVMFLNVDEASHVYLSLAHTYISIFMALLMAILVLLIVSKMYPDKKWTVMIIVGSIVLSSVVLVALQPQTQGGDVQCMKAMMPHHASAIITGK